MNILNNLSIKNKIWSVTILFLFGFLFLGYYFISTEKELLINEKKSKLINVVDLAHSIIKSEYKAFQEGVIDEATAKKNAMQAIKNLRYNKVDYIWINDDVLPFPTMVMHPTVSKLDGKILDAEKFNCATSIQFGLDNKMETTDGKKNLFQAFVEVVNKEKSGFVIYMWPKPIEGGGTTEETYPKLSHVQKFEPWGWVFGSGIYIDDVDANTQQSIIKAFGIIAILMLLIILVFSLLIKEIGGKMREFQDGLLHFFSYLNRQTNVRKNIEIDATDEFGIMAKLINKNIEQIEKNIIEDDQFIVNTHQVMKRVENGWFSEHIEANTNNPNLLHLKETINKSLDNLKERFLVMNELLTTYNNNDYRKKLVIDGVEANGVFDALIKNINKLEQRITDMLIDNKQNGLTLDKSSDILLENVDILNRNSNEAAAALEEITSNISSNTTNIVKMANFASSVTASSNEGQKLALQTTVAMDEINKEVNSINEAITIIDQIAFQTNILSLNAAVEAATAGEAGKGFAVVAQEVRNLATRSADAANEIKKIVQNATQKANNGKQIADSMISGYTILNENIEQTINLIKDVEMASKEQLQGIEQINDAVASLDQQTQKNAMIASQTHDVAVETDTIAKLVVSNANSCEFNGKNEVKAK